MLTAFNYAVGGMSKRRGRSGITAIILVLYSGVGIVSTGLRRLISIVKGKVTRQIFAQ